MKLGKLERQILTWLWANREAQSQRSYNLAPGMWGPHDLAEGLNGAGTTRSQLVSIVRAGKRLKEKGLLWGMRKWRSGARKRLVRQAFIANGEVYSGYYTEQRYPCEWFALSPCGAALMDTLGEHIRQGKRLRHQMLQIVEESPMLNVSCLGCGQFGRWNADEWACAPAGYWHSPCHEKSLTEWVAATREMLKVSQPQKW